MNSFQHWCLHQHALTLKFWLTHCLLADLSTAILYWKSPFGILGASGLFCPFYSIFDEKSCKQTM